MSPARVGRTSGPCRAPAGSKVELVFDPFDLTVRHHGRPAGKATPFKIGQYVHPKAAADTPPSPVTHRGRLPAAAGGPADPCPGRTAPLRPTRRSDSPDRTDGVDRPDHAPARPLFGPDHSPASLDRCHPCRSEEASMCAPAGYPARASGSAPRTNDIDTDERHRHRRTKARPSRSEEGHPTNRPPAVDKRCPTADPDFGLVTALVGWYGSMAGRQTATATGASTKLQTRPAVGKSVGALRPDRPSDLDPVSSAQWFRRRTTAGHTLASPSMTTPAFSGLRSAVRHAGPGLADHVTDGHPSLAGGDLRPW